MSVILFLVMKSNYTVVWLERCTYVCVCVCAYVCMCAYVCVWMTEAMTTVRQIRDTDT